MSYVTLTQLVTQVSRGEAIASFPTDTVPALAAIPSIAEQIYTLKQRSLDKPLILLAGDVEALWDYVSGAEAERQIWRSLMQQYFPGALTLVLPASDRVPIAMNPRNPGTIGVRIPNHALARQILRQTGPLATTSANISGQDTLLDMAAIAQAFPSVLQLSDSALQALALPTAPLQSSGTPSTVVQWQTDRWQILRQGAVILPTAILQAEPRSIQ